ncbi:DUF3429 domain-containing protein [Motiliproteus coralliicola]|uniref:DUF3429 domain-containing protein n=1 Tax=Motiliproteus coralliicola TaxID=2283196 RepID=A0A369WD07_9GAMM|nr:DUF3429 domain-containing protein [Motiliproteus coralliicola]RDE19517.1 DUF3429 domain-containing protein [Motiliproteus coralliicola]
MHTLQRRNQVQVYSWLGVVPFILLGALLPVWPASMQSQAIESFGAYGAVILAFMAGAIWLPAILTEESKPLPTTSIAVLLSLLAFLVVLLPIELGLGLSGSGFLLLLVTEIRLRWKLRYPNWYWSMRIMLTATVTLCHLLAGLWLWL